MTSGGCRVLMQEGRSAACPTRRTGEDRANWPLVQCRRAQGIEFNGSIGAQQGWNRLRRELDTSEGKMGIDGGVAAARYLSPT
jgi:hypothetical protein